MSYGGCRLAWRALGCSVIVKTVMVKTKAKHHHKKRVRYPARFFGSVGYVGLAVAWLQVLGIAGSLVIDGFLSLFPQTTEEETPSTIGSLLLQNTTSMSSTDSSLITKLFLGMLLIAVMVTLGHFVADRSSKLLKSFLRSLGLTLSLRLLLGAKCMMALAAVLTQLVVVLLLSRDLQVFVYLIVSITASFAILAVVGFAVQHLIARTQRMDVKHIL